MWVRFQGSFSFALSHQPGGTSQLSVGTYYTGDASDLQMTRAAGSRLAMNRRLELGGARTRVRALNRVPCSTQVEDHQPEVPQLPLCQGATEREATPNPCSTSAESKGKELAPCNNPFAIDCHESFWGGGSGGSGMIGVGIGSGGRTGLVGGGGNGSGGSGGGGNHEVGESSCTVEERAAAEAEERLKKEDKRRLDEANQRVYADMSEEVAALVGLETPHTMSLDDVMRYGRRHGDVYDLQDTIAQDLSGDGGAADPGDENLGDPSDQPMDPFLYYGGKWRRRLLNSGRRHYVSPAVYKEFAPLHKATLDELQPKKTNSAAGARTIFQVSEEPLCTEAYLGLRVGGVEARILCVLCSRENDELLRNLKTQQRIQLCREIAEACNI